VLPVDPTDEELARDWTLSEADKAEVRRCRGDANRRHFDQAIQERLTGWLEARAAEGPLPIDLLRRAEDQLRAWRVVLPVPSTLERLVASVVAGAQQELFERITRQLPEELKPAIDELLQPPEGDNRSRLFRLKEYPPQASAPAILKYIERYRSVEAIVAHRITLGGIDPRMVSYLAQLAKRYDAQALKRFAPAKRYALVACFLAEARKTLLDHVVEMHDQYLIEMCRRAHHAFEEQHRLFRRKAKEGLETVLTAVDLVLDSASETRLDQLHEQIDEQTLREAVRSCRHFQRLEERGCLDELCARYAPLRRYLPAFFGLSFQAQIGSESLVAAIDLVRRLDGEEQKTLPVDAPRDFVPAAWRAALERGDGSLERNLWEIALSLAVRDALRAGDLTLAESRRHVSFWNLVYDENQWAREREEAYTALALPNEADRVLDKLRQEYREALERAERGLADNPFATVREGRLHLKRPDALEIPERVKQVKRVVETSLPHVRIEDLLQEVDRLCGFTRALRPLSGYEPRVGNLYQTLLGALIAHGTNLGIAAMAHSVERITVDLLQYVSQMFLTEATLKAATARLVDYHHRLALSSVYGAGTASSSDGQRFGIQASSLLASFYPRYFGYYERAITLYTHTSDQYSVFGTRVISCSPREALYVLDGLLENDTILRPREHYTDTHGFTEQLFGLCFLLGYSFMPRLRDLADQQLYKVDRSLPWGQLQSIFHSGADLDLIPEQWDPLVRVAASLRNRVVPAHVVLQRLSSASPSDRVAKALTTLGRVVKTIFILRYLHQEELRRRVQLQLNRGEARHELAHWLFFANRGEFRTGDYEEMMNKASCLSLLSNAVLVWNTTKIGNIVGQLRASGEQIEDADLARVPPLAHRHVIPNGTYFLNQVVGDPNE
jgi:TnpA family transposase